MGNFTQNSSRLKWVKGGNWRGDLRTSQDLGLGEGLILGAGRPFDHPCRDTDGDGAGRDVVSKKSENSNNEFFTRRHPTIEMLLPKTAQGRNG